MALRGTAELHSTSGVCPLYSSFIYTFALLLYLDEPPPASKLSTECEDWEHIIALTGWRFLGFIFVGMMVFIAAEYELILIHHTIILH